MDYITEQDWDEYNAYLDEQGEPACVHCDDYGCDYCEEIEFEESSDEFWYD